MHYIRSGPPFVYQIPSRKMALKLPPDRAKVEGFMYPASTMVMSMNSQLQLPSCIMDVLNKTQRKNVFLPDDSGYYCAIFLKVGRINLYMQLLQSVSTE